MLTHLAIRNIVLVEAADITLSEGFNVLTGETGAGKSILLDALGLALGTRAEGRLVRTGAEQGSVTASFEMAPHAALAALLDELGIEYAGELIIRRILSAEGKTRCFINDEPVSVGALKRLGERLVEIHGQHDQRGLMEPHTHLDTLDGFAKTGKAREGVAAQHRQWQQAKSALAALEAEIAQARREEEYLRHIARELRALSPSEGEEEQLAEARRRMMQGEKIAAALTDAMQELQGQKPALQQLRVAERILTRSIPADRQAELVGVIGALERAGNDIEEAQQALERLHDAVQFNPARLEEAEERLFALRDAARKHGTDVDGLATVLREAEQKLAHLDHGEKGIAGLRKTCEAARHAFAESAAALSAARRKSAVKLEKAVMAELASLKMAGTGFRVTFEEKPEAAWSQAGIDQVRFEVATNAGSEFAPLHKIASGGELSRFMLALKVVLAGTSGAGTFIFDEIDSGTGGAVAEAIGQRLAKLAATHQVLVVTHLPQVAASANHHLLITKETQKRRTFTQVAALGKAERKEELARMLAGAEITREARSAAGKLMEVASGR